MASRVGTEGRVRGRKACSHPAEDQTLKGMRAWGPKVSRRGSGARRVFRVFGVGPSLGPLEMLAVRRTARRDIWLGDPRFDGEIAVCGDETQARALLGAERRAAVLELFEAGLVRLRIRAGAWSGIGEGEAASAEVRSLLLRLWAVAEARPELERLLAVASEDPEVRVRAAAGDALLGAARRAEPEEQWRVCQALLVAPRARERQRAEAAWAMARQAPREAADVLARVIRLEGSPSPALVDAYGFASARAGALDPVLDLVQGPSPSVAAAAVRALSEAVDCPAVRGPVLEQLRGGSPSVRRAAACALGHATVDLGPVTRVLGAICEARTEEPSVRRAAARAAARVRRRGSPPGALSFAAQAGAEGALSERPDRKG